MMIKKHLMGPQKEILHINIGSKCQKKQNKTKKHFTPAERITGCMLSKLLRWSMLRKSKISAGGELTFDCH